MRRRKLLHAFLASFLVPSLGARSNDEERIKELLDRLAAAVRAKDVSRVLECYSQNAGALVFDIQGRFAGPTAVQSHWKDVLTSIQGPMQFELSDVAITAGGTVAYVHCLERVIAVKRGQKPIDMTVRNTRGLRKVNDRWLIEHEHVSAQMT